MVASVLVLSMGLKSGILYLLVACLFVIVIPLTFWIRASGTATLKDQRKGVRTEISAGLGYIVSRPKLRPLWLFWTLIVVTGFAAMQTLVPGILEREFGRSPSEGTVINLIWGLAALPVNLFLAGRFGGCLIWPLLFITSAMLAGGMWLTDWVPAF